MLLSPTSLRRGSVLLCGPSSWSFFAALVLGPVLSGGVAPHQKVLFAVFGLYVLSFVSITCIYERCREKRLSLMVALEGRVALAFSELGNVAGVTAGTYQRTWDDYRHGAS
jgi:hypothetical protein